MPNIKSEINISKRLLLMLFGLFLFPYNVHASKISFLTHYIKPFTYENQGKTQGFAVEIVETLMKQTDTIEEITIYPFKRALQTVQTTPNHALFVVARRPDRENTVQWVGPIISSGVYFYKRKNSLISIRNLQDIKNLNAIGVQLGNADYTYLKAQGVSNFNQTISQTQSLEMLHRGRIDATPMSELVFSEIAAEAGIGINNFERIDFKLYDSVLYIAFSKDVPNETIIAWQHALDSIKSSGLYDKIYNKYIH